MKMLEFKDFGKSKLILIGSTLVIIVMILILNSHENKKNTSLESNKVNVTRDIGISVGGVEEHAYIQRLEKNYYDFEDRIKTMESQVKNIQSSANQLTSSQKDIAHSVLKLDESLAIKIEQKLDDFKSNLQSINNVSQDKSLKKDVELSIANIADVELGDWVYLPIGSFCQGTLLTGVYAAADSNNPLPVLISLDEAFYGPNKSRIPLKGAFVLGKAYGDLVSERALIQIVAISAVLPDGRAFENEENLGYVTDEMGELGIKGQIVYNTGRQLALSFMGGFVSGGAQAIADSQTTTHKTIQGDTSRDVTGNSGKNALFSGLAQSAGKLSEYYEKQAEELIPAVHITNGSKIYFIVQKGIEIKGLDRGKYKSKF